MITSTKIANVCYIVCRILCRPGQRISDTWNGRLAKTIIFHLISWFHKFNCFLMISVWDTYIHAHIFNCVLQLDSLAFSFVCSLVFSVSGCLLPASISISLRWAVRGDFLFENHIHLFERNEMGLPNLYSHRHKSCEQLTWLTVCLTTLFGYNNSTIFHNNMSCELNRTTWTELG